MDQLNINDLPVIKRALEQYKKVLHELTNDDKIIHVKIFSDELLKLSSQINELIKAMNRDRRFDLVYNNKSYFRDALSSYVRYLQDTKKTIYDKLGSKPKFESIEKEIDAVEEILPKLSD